MPRIVYSDRESKVPLRTVHTFPGQRSNVRRRDRGHKEICRTRSTVPAPSGSVCCRLDKDSRKDFCCRRKRRSWNPLRSMHRNEYTVVCKVPSDHTFLSIAVAGFHHFCPFSLTLPVSRRSRRKTGFPVDFPSRRKDRSPKLLPAAI